MYKLIRAYTENKIDLRRNLKRGQKAWITKSFNQLQPILTQRTGSTQTLCKRAEVKAGKTALGISGVRLKKLDYPKLGNTKLTFKDGKIVEKSNAFDSAFLTLNQIPDSEYQYYFIRAGLWDLFDKGGLSKNRVLERIRELQANYANHQEWLLGVTGFTPKKGLAPIGKALRERYDSLTKSNRRVARRVRKNRKS